ncbi:HEAT repeat domain-containing protein, partial [bacterium]|nr:HEAT repeat domain-containing protein [bacterium]
GIWALRMFLVFGAVSVGASDVLGKINYSSFVEYSPRTAFSGFVSTLVIASLHTMMMLVWLALLSAPSVRRWVHSGVRTNEEALELRLEQRKRTEGFLSTLVLSGKIESYGFYRGRFEKGKLIRVCSYLFVGLFPFVAIAYVALVVGRPVPIPVEMSFESLVAQLEAEDHWQLRVRRAVTHYVSSEILHFSDATTAKMPPSSVPELRLEAVMGLADSGVQAVKPLLNLLSDSNERIRLEAARSLGVIGKDASEALPSLREMILNPNLPSSSGSRRWEKGSLRHELASALVQIARNDPLTLETIVSGLDLASGLSLTGLVPDLSEIRTPNAMLANLLLCEALLTGEEEIVFSILRDLRSIDINRIASRPSLSRESTLIEIATKLLSHSNPAIRREAALLLSDVSMLTTSLTEQMATLILDPHPAVGSAAIHAVETWERPVGGQTIANLRVYLDRLVESDRSNVGNDYWEDSTSLLRPAKGSRKNKVMQSSHVSLHEFGLFFSSSRPSDSFDHVKRNLDDMMHLNQFETITIRRMLIRALGVQGREAESSVPRLRDIVLDHEAPERWEAAIALWKITQNTEDLLSVLESFVKDSKSLRNGDPRYEILFSAVETFGEIGDVALSSLSEFLTYENNGLRLKAYLEVERLLPTNPQLRSVVESLIDDSYIAIRLRAQKALSLFDAKR